MNRGVIIVAGGSGQRMESHVPKQYMDLAGKPVIVHTLEKFLNFDPDMELVLVLAAEHTKYWKAVSKSHGFGTGIKIAKGGKTRTESVKNGLQLIKDDIIVGIHDAVRPLVSYDTLTRCYEKAAIKGSGIPVIGMDETVRMIKEDNQSIHMDRSSLRRVQTPQVFKSELIKKAYNRTGNQDFTDDASVYESCYDEVFLVEGNRENIKITNPADLQLASVLIRLVE
jgi:2-C-methyl-D-erythritol 4-phosphate cytidylyltransferase